MSNEKGGVCLVKSSFFPELKAFLFLRAGASHFPFLILF